MFRVSNDWDDKEFVLSQVKKDGMSLKKASSRLKEDFEVVLTAALQNRGAIPFANKSLLKNPEFFLYIIENSTKEDPNLDGKLEIFYLAKDEVTKKKTVISSLAKLDITTAIKVMHYTLRYNLSYMYSLWESFGFGDTFLDSLKDHDLESAYQLEMQYEKVKGEPWSRHTKKELKRTEDIDTKKTDFSYLFKNNITKLAISQYKGKKSSVISLFKLYSYVVDIRSNDIEEANLFRGKTLPLWKAILKEQGTQFTPNPKVIDTITQSLQVIDAYFKNNKQPLDSPSLQQEKVTLYKASRYKTLIVNLVEYLVSFFSHMGIKVKPLQIVSDVSNIKVIGLMADAGGESLAVSQMSSQVTAVKDKLTQNFLSGIQFSEFSKSTSKGIEYYFDNNNNYISLDTLKKYNSLEELLADTTKEKIIDKNYSKFQVSEGKVILKNKVVKTINYLNPNALQAKISEYQSKIDNYNSKLESYEKKLSNDPKVVQLGDHQVNTVKVLYKNISRLIVIDGPYQGHYVDELVSSTGEVIGSVSKASVGLAETSKVFKSINKFEIESVFTEPIEFSNLQKISDYVSPKNLDTIFDTKYLTNISKMGLRKDTFHNIVGNTIFYNIRNDRRYTSSVLKKHSETVFSNRTEYMDPVENVGTQIELIRQFHFNTNGSPDYIANILFDTSPCFPEGLGSRVFTQQVKSASEAGFKYIETVAGMGGKYVGYYVWPKFGYNVKVYLTEDMENPRYVVLYNYLKRWLQKNSNSYATEEKGFSANLLDIYACKAGDRFIGQELWKEVGETRTMIFDLTPNSLSMRILEAYISLKAKKEGMDPKDYLNVDYSRYTNYNLACLLDKYFRYGDQEIESKELERRLEDSIRNYENGELFRIYQDPKTRPKLVAFLNIVKDFKPKVVEDVLLILNQKGYQNIKLASDDQMSEDPMLREIDESIMKQVWNGINKLYEAGTFK